MSSKTAKIALASIYQALPEDVLLMVTGKDSAKQAWETLKTMHIGVERDNEVKVRTLRTHFEAIRIKDGESVDDFAKKLTSVVAIIRSLEEKVEEIYVVKKFLRALPQKYMQIVTEIEQFGDLKNMTIEEVVSRLKVHEERLRGYDEREEDKHLLLTHAEWMSRMKKNWDADFSSCSSSRSGTMEMAKVMAKVGDEGEVEAEVVVIGHLDKKTPNPAKTRAQ